MTASKIVLNAASGAASDPVDVENVFRTFVYEGTGSAQTITNGIDLSGEGGLVWVKNRDSAGYDHQLIDTARGGDYALRSDSPNAHVQSSQSITAFNNNGFTVGNAGNLSSNNNSHVSWTFRKAKKFFDIVTYTGTGSTRTLSHNLDCEIGQIWIKCTSSAYNWQVFSKGVGGYMQLNLRDGEAGSSGTTFFNNATTTQFTITGGGNTMNASGETYVAYLFAHNNNNGTFGPDGDQDIIKVGTYTGDGNATGALQNLGFEPQFILIKNTNLNTERWHLYDHTRGIHTNRNDYYLMPNENGAELNHETVQVEPTGFRAMTSDDKTNGNGRSYMYMAIRRGPLAVPEDATKVFSVNAATSDNIFNIGFDADFNINTVTIAGYEKYTLTKMLSHYNMFTNGTTQEQTQSGVEWFDYKSNFINLNASWWSTNSNLISWTWKRAPSYFDIRTYPGSGTGTTVTHGLGVVPEMIWFKGRDVTENWVVYHKDVGNNKYLRLNSNAAQINDSSGTRFDNANPTSSVIHIGSDNEIGASNYNYVAYLFATAAGVSKVGSYTGNGSSKNIDCGFTNGSRFVLIKKYSDTGHWMVFDSARGIIAGNDSMTKFNNSNAVDTSYDRIDSHSSGFTVNDNGDGDTNPNVNNATYIFYAIA
tara:strand:- start:56 stop:1993 length:1938 start_codon:yes stop_codon:yes gene_type:complete